MTESLYWMRDHEIDEGSEVWGYSANGYTRFHKDEIIKKSSGALGRFTKDGHFIKGPLNTRCVVFILAPKERPKPNSWDNDLDSSGNFKLDRMLLRNNAGLWVLNKNVIISNSPQAKRLQAWINHLMDVDSKGNKK